MRSVKAETCRQSKENDLLLAVSFTVSKCTALEGSGRGRRQAWDSQTLEIWSQEERLTIVRVTRNSSPLEGRFALACFCLPDADPALCPLQVQIWDTIRRCTSHPICIALPHLPGWPTRPVCVFWVQLSPRFRTGSTSVLTTGVILCIF